MRIRESNFHSSLIQGAQNFDKIVTSGNSAGNIKDTKPEDKKPKARRRKVMDAMSQAQGLDRRLYLTSE